jgi:nicotinamide riboside kinase
MNDEIPIKKIVVIGPESTGKSTLCKQLAEHFNTLWCPEYARGYLLTHGKEYSYNDLLAIAKGQLELEDEYTEKVRSTRYEVQNIGDKNQEPKIKNQAEITERNWKLETGNLKPETGNSKLQKTNDKRQTINNKLLFIDTDMYVMKVWCEYVFGMCHQFIVDQIAERKYNLYLLCNIDLPWVPDELREYPEEAPRKELYQIYKNILINQQTPWVEIGGGDYEKRLQKGIKAVEKYIL